MAYKIQNYNPRRYTKSPDKDAFKKLVEKEIRLVIIRGMWRWDMERENWRKVAKKIQNSS